MVDGWMDGFLSRLGRQIADRWHTPRQPRTPRAYRCLCGAAVFFRNSGCLSCGRALGFDPAGRTLTGDYQIDALDVARWRPYLDPLLASYTSLRPASLRLSSSGQLTLGLCS